jgi:riboflavin kinase/FMN adenylyltransferase
MRIHRGLSDTVNGLTSGSVAIGNFDGVHLGHAALFRAAHPGGGDGRSANAHGIGAAPLAALTFEPHPARILAPKYAPPLICERARKLELLEALGVTDVVEQPFDAAFAQTEPSRFVEMLVATGVREVVVGHDFTYGKGRSGGIESLRLGLEVRTVRLVVVPKVEVNGLVCSSTKIREFVLEGRMEAANMLLGRPFDVDGDVVRGEGRGRKLGIPTANIRTQNELLPAIGVYAVRARLHGESKVLPGAANLGLNPTFRENAALAGGSGRPPLSLEVHLFDFDRDIYGKRLRVEFVSRLREERRFPGIDALKAQINADIALARRLLGA